MNELIAKTKELLSSHTVNVVIGYGKGSGKFARAEFIHRHHDSVKMIYDDTCLQNLATYIMKHEVKHLGKIAIVANNYTLRSILVLASECQIVDGQILALYITKDKKIVEMHDFKSIEDHLATVDTGIKPGEKEIVDRIEKMTIAERWDFWQKEFSKCFKCFACRSSCPMCYCTKCMTESNQPQWITVAAHDLGNMEWHIMRAMHLAGRCVNCGDCARACPMDIPLNLLTYNLIEGIEKDFGAKAGMKATDISALSTFRPGDKENFIK